MGGLGGFEPALLLVPLVVAVVLGIGYLFYRLEQQRIDRWHKACAARGWTYASRKDREVGDYFEFLRGLGKGRNRYATDLVRGTEEGRPFHAFSYHYETTEQSGDTTRTVDNWLSVVAIQLERPFPELLIAPEHFGKRLLNKFTGSDINFESHEFSRRFEVKSHDRKFAYDFCNTSMMEYLLQYPGTNIEVDGAWMATIGDDKLEFDEIQPAINHLLNIRERMPRFLFT